MNIEKRPFASARVRPYLAFAECSGRHLTQLIGYATSELDEQQDFEVLGDWPVITIRTDAIFDAIEGAPGPFEGVFVTEYRREVRTLDAKAGA